MNERISVNPKIYFGKPCVAGTRIPVQSVLELVREGLSFNEIIRDYYPDLAPVDIQACVQYAIDVVAINQKSVPERLKLIQKIWISLADQVDSKDLPDWHLDEVMRRREAARLTPGSGKPFREVLEKLEAGS